MIVLGILLAITAALMSLPSILFWLGVVLIVAGLIANLVPIGGSRHRWY